VVVALAGVAAGASVTEEEEDSTCSSVWVVVPSSSVEVLS
jgi:hypothetical protein